MQSRSLRYLPLLALIILFSRAAHAATLNVPSQYATIQAAVSAAQNGDTVLIADGTYTGPGNVDIDPAGKNITVTSQNGAATTIIDCQGSASANHRGFYLHSGETSSVISGLTIQNGYEYGSGGGINATAVGASIQNCILKGNTAVYGGGIYNSTGSAAITVTNCVITGNTANGYGSGGGIYDNNNGSAAIKITNCTFTGNIAQSYNGGGVYCVNSSQGGGTTITNDILYGDTGREIGGAVATVSYSDVQGGYQAGYRPIGGINADPLFVSPPTDFHLQLTSPCIGVGTASGTPTTTIDGHTRPNPPSMGAYEVVSTGTTATSVILTSSPNPSVVGQSVAFTANVVNNGATGATPTGTVTVVVDGQAQTPVSLNNGSIASYSTSTLTVGSHKITAVYSGDPNFAYSTSTPIMQTVQPAPQYVSPSGSDTNPGTKAAPKLTIQAAINAVSIGGTVMVEDGTYTGPGDIDLDFGGKSITVTSQNGPTGTIIDCGGSSTANHRGFYLHSGETNAIISGLTITNGYETYGGGIDNENSTTDSVSISNCILTKNSAEYGGGIYINNGSSGTATVTSCTFIGNTANFGGGFSDRNLGSDTITLTRCLFSGNIAQDGNSISYAGGGGVYNQNINGGQITIANCTFAANSAQSSTGAVQEAGGLYNYNYLGTITVTDCTFTENSVPGGDGGGIYNGASTGPIAVTNCVLVGNQAGKGGGICNYNSDNGTIAITNCTLIANSAAAGQGGGVCNETYLNDGTTTLTNDILYGDSGGEYAFTANNYGFTGATVTVSSCDIQDGFSGTGNFKAGTGNISADPLFVGSPSDLHLGFGSPCLGAGTASGAPATTVDGMTRPNPPSIGAYEVGQSGTTTTLASNLNPSAAGQSVTFTATITGTSGTPTGTIIFTVDGAAQPPVTLSSGQAAFSTTSLAAGSHSVTAAYSGDQFNAASASAALTQTVNPAMTGVVVNDTSSGLVYSGYGWFYNGGRGLGDVQNDVHATTNNGDTVSYIFTGTAISVLTETNTDEGNVQVYLDGTLQATVSAYSAARQVQQVLWSASGLTAGSHTVKLVKASGTYMLLDALQVTPLPPAAGVVNDTNSSIAYTGASWGYYPNRGAGDVQDDVHAASANGDSLTFSFTGPSVSYLTETNADEGSIDVYLDGAFQATVNGYSPGRQTQQTLWKASGLSSGSHTLKLVKTGGSYLLVDAFAATPASSVSVATLNDTSSGLVYSGSGWFYNGGRGLGDVNDDVHATTVNGDTVSCVFTGTSVSYFTETNNDEGTADVYVDGVFQQTVSCYSASRQVDQSVYSVSGLAFGSHTIKIVKTSGTYLLLDAISFQ